VKFFIRLQSMPGSEIPMISSGISMPPSWVGIASDPTSACVGGPLRGI